MRYLLAAAALGAASILLRTWTAPPEAGVPERAQTAAAVRQMASYLEAADARERLVLTGRPSAPPLTREGGGDRAPAQAVVDASGAAESDAVASGLARIERTELRIAARYPDGATGAAVRRYVALDLEDVDTDHRADLSRTALAAGLAHNSLDALAGIQGALTRLPERDAGPARERASLVRLASLLGAEPAALPAIDAILVAELGYRSRSTDADVQTDATTHDRGILELVDAHSALAPDPRRRIDFLRSALPSVSAAATRDGLERRIEAERRQLDLQAQSR